MYNWFNYITSGSGAEQKVVAKQASIKSVAGLNWDNEEYKVGDTFTISVNPGYVANFLSAEIVLNYDSEILKINRISSGSGLNDYGYKFPVLHKLSPGTLTANMVVLGNLREGLSISGENLFDIEFEVIGNGTFSVNLSDIDIRNFLNIPNPVWIENESIVGKIGTSQYNKPLSFGLSQNFPNPFNASTTINYTLNNSGRIDITIYNSIGQVIKTLVNDYREAGHYSVVWNGTNDDGINVTSGVYIITIRQGNRFDKKQALLVK